MKKAEKVGDSFLIVKVNDVRDAVPMKFEEAKDTLLRLISQREQKKLLFRLKKQYNVEEFNEDGTPYNPSINASISDDEDEDDGAPEVLADHVNAAPAAPLASPTAAVVPAAPVATTPPAGITAPVASEPAPAPVSAPLPAPVQAPIPSSQPVTGV
jgi:hypothetical protein